LENALTGTLRLHKALQSRFLDEARDIIVYLPPQYNASTEARFPVLYLHDGQNLFDPATAFAGNDWGLDDLAEDLISKGKIEPVIIVGIYNTGVNRMAEYTHVKDRRGRGGRAKFYAKLIVNDLKPFIDNEYRTLSDPPNTGLGGSSLGGLVTLYLGLRHSNIFGKLIVMSPSVWWANRAILREVGRLKRKLPQKIWLDIGTAEGSNPEHIVHDARMLRDTLVDKGWVSGEDFRFVEDEGAGHNEKAWGYRMNEALQFLFPPKHH
jgi:predicted alpha/beta superfamily hydrolase